MVFSSPVFLFVFLPAILLCYFFGRKSFRNWILVLFSLLFYAFGEPKKILLMLLSILVNYAAGLLMEKYPRRKKLFLVLSVVYNLGMLFIFKYLNFAADTVCRILGKASPLHEIVMPIGISFYTFQILSYVIDVYRGKCRAQHDLLSMALYVSLFPQLIAGPIVRYTDIEKQIREREHSVNRAADGMLRFAIGFSKKILIADQLAPLVNTAFSGSHASLLVNWVGMIAYALQIYYDFSGYSDMAIGLGKIFGFDFAENFDYPYIARSVREFWKRWHISLSSWFRDYLYIPLGGNRKGTARTYLNLMIVFLATGLWHGASFNFIVWGMFYAVFLIIERLGFEKWLQKIPSFFRHFYTLLVVLFAWIFFRADNLSAALTYIRNMFIWTENDLTQLTFVMDGQYWFCLAAGILFAMPVMRKWIRQPRTAKGPAILYAVFTLVVFVIAICYMVGSGYSPFLYFRF